MDTQEYKGYSIKIEWDDDPQNPRENDNLGHMVCWYNRYNLGDWKAKPTFTDPTDFQNWVIDNPSIVLPLYLYDHSGISMSTGRDYPYNCPWDSGQVGYIYVTLAAVREEYSAKRISAALRRKVADLLISEVKEYNQYLTGEVYGYTIELDGEFIDSCRGYYGFEYCQSEARDLVDWYAKQAESKAWEAVSSEPVYA